MMMLLIVSCYFGQQVLDHWQNTLYVYVYIDAARFYTKSASKVMRGPMKMMIVLLNIYI